MFLVFYYICSLPDRQGSDKAISMKNKNKRY